MPSVEGGEPEYPELSTALQSHLREAHHNLAAGGLTAEEALEQHYQEHHAPGGLRNHAEPADLHNWQETYVQAALAFGTMEVLKDEANRLRADVLAELDKGPARWATRTRPDRGDQEKVMGPFPKISYEVWKQSLTRAEQWAHCGKREHHLAHEHTVCFTGETPNPHVPCVGTPNFAFPVPARRDPVTTPPPVYPILDVEPSTEQREKANEYDEEHLRALRPGSQPLPVPRKDGPSAHDAVIADLYRIMGRRIETLRASGHTKEADAIRKLTVEIKEDLNRRRALGLQRYGSLLQPGNGRDPLRDAYEEVVDLVCYFRQFIMARDDAMTLLVELLNDRAVGEDPVVREKVGRVIYLLAGEIKEGSNDGSVEP